MQKSKSDKLLHQECEALTHEEPRAKPWEGGTLQIGAPKGRYNTEINKTTNKLE